MSNNQDSMSNPRILSMGSGVQTTYILFKYWERYANGKGVVIFADDGDEKPETYYYIEKYLKPFCEGKNIEWVTVKSKLGTLMNYCMKKKLIPTRSFRWCTHKFKIMPIRKEVRKRGATAKNPFYQDIGITTDEIHRANGQKYDTLYLKSEYPLLDTKESRQNCADGIKAMGYPIPPKSGCYYCPYAKKKEMRKLHAEHRILYDKASIMEQNNGQYPKMTLFSVPLKNLNENTSLDDFDDELGECDSGHCFV